MRLVSIDSPSCSSHPRVVLRGALFLICSLWMRNDHYILSVRNQRDGSIVSSSRRLTRSLTTAFPTFLPSPSAQLDSDHPPGVYTIKMLARRIFDDPFSAPAECPGDSLRRRSRGRPSVLPGCACWGQLGPGATTLGAATLDDIPTTGGLHPGTEAVVSLTLDVASVGMCASFEPPGSTAAGLCRGVPVIAEAENQGPAVKSPLSMPVPTGARKRSHFMTTLARARDPRIRKVPRGTLVENPRTTMKT